jgi:hypothetical protein
MAENPHDKELLQIFNDFEVEYLIVGGFPVVKTLKRFGTAIEHDQITFETVTYRQAVYQIAIARLRIDIPIVQGL